MDRRPVVLQDLWVFHARMELLRDPVNELSYYQVFNLYDIKKPLMDCIDHLM